MLGHLTNTIEGVHVIRGFEKQACCTRDFDGHYNLFSGVWMTHMAVFQWFQLWNNIIGGLFIICVTYVCVMAASSEFK